MEFALLGIPEGETAEIYIFKFTYRTDRPLCEVRSTVDVFGSNFFVDKIKNERGYLDYSIELAQRLLALGFEGVKAMALRHS